MLINGWRLDDYNYSKNRTRKQYDFLAALCYCLSLEQKKRFTGLEAYQSSVYIKDGDEVKDCEIRLDTTQSDIKGDYNNNNW